MLSRATSLKNVHIPQGVSFKRLTEEITKKPGTTTRIAEEKRLAEMFHVTKHNYGWVENLII